MADHVSAAVAPLRKVLRVVINEDENPSAAMEKALAEHMAAHPEEPHGCGLQVGGTGNFAVATHNGSIEAAKTERLSARPPP